jgi:hypothetical protein
MEEDANEYYLWSKLVLRMSEGSGSKGLNVSGNPIFTGSFPFLISK